MITCVESLGFEAGRVTQVVQRLATISSNPSIAQKKKKKKKTKNQPNKKTTTKLGGFK
jgi:hypothetical protein